MTAFLPAQVVKLVDTGDSKSPAARCVGSSPTLGTTLKNKLLQAVIFLSNTIQRRKPNPITTGLSGRLPSNLPLPDCPIPPIAV